MLTERIQLESDEIILAQVRKHWFIITIQMASVVFAALVPLLLPMVFSFVPIPVTIEVPASLFVSLYTGWLIMMWMALFGVWTNYYLDVWTVTNKRLITVDQRGLFHRDTGSFRLERLQDININIRGIIATLLKFGDLEAETASGDKNFTARGIPDPQELKALILKASDAVTFVHPPVQNAPTATAPQQINDGL